MSAATTRQRRRILLVAYYYPPLNSIGARRPSALAKWLRRRGHDVTVLTSVNSGRLPDDRARGTVRAHDLLATRLNWRGRSHAVATGQVDAPWNPGRGFWGSIVVPDIQLVSWAPFALGQALRLHRRRHFDVVITTSPVESVHAVGIALQRKGVPWIADMRDGWRFEAPREDWPLKLQRWIDARLEQLVVRRADEVVIVTEPLAADLRARHGIAVETLTNGFDPDDVPTAEPELDRNSGDPCGPGGRPLVLAHTGGIGRERTLRPLLAALARLAKQQPGLHERIRLVLAGAQTPEERALYAQRDFAPFVEHHGFVPREQALALQRSADVLVLVTTGVRRGEATGKLFEYLAARRPILVLGTETAAATMVEEAGAGVAIPVRDVDAAEAAVRRILAGDFPSPPPGAADRYAYPEIAARYEQVIERAIARRAR